MDSDKKLQLIDLLMHEDDDNILEQVSTILEHSVHDHWDNSAPDLKASLEEGLKDIEEGRVFSHKKAMEKLNRELGK